MTEPTTTIDSLEQMSAADLEQLFRNSPAGPIPVGEAEGRVLVAPGTVITEPAAALVHLIAWKGKVFDPASGTLRNEVGPLGTHAVEAKVYKDISWFDGKEAVILDYSQTSEVAHWIRDEIRLVGPDLYLGLVFFKKDKVLDFALDFSAQR
jgi:hypothetical protein